MKWLRFLRRAKRDAECERDIQFYIDTETTENLARGLPFDEARAAALRKFGNPALVREDVRRLSSLGFVENVWRDAVYALRAMGRNPVFAITAVLTIALGIGANTAIFTMVNAILLKPLAYRDPGRLLRISVDNPLQHQEDVGFTLLRLQEMSATQSFEEMGAFFIGFEDLAMTDAGGAESVRAARISANLLHVLGVQPLIGRNFLPEEDRTGGPPVALLGAQLWKRRFGADPNIAGKTIVLDLTPHTIVGVMPDGFQFPRPGMDLWIPRPAEFSPIPARFWATTNILVGVGRLNPGVSMDQARAELQVRNRQYVEAHPGPGDSGPSVTLRLAGLKDQMVANVGPMLWMLLGAVGFVLLIACANVAGLVLARVSSRSREFAVRAALGAGRSRLIGQLLIESLLLSAAGGAIGVLLGRWGLRALVGIEAFRLPRTAEIHLDGTVLAVTLALSLLTGIVVGLSPALQMSRPDLADVLRLSGAAAGRTLARKTLLGLTPRGLLVVGQCALSVVLLIGAALLLESLARIQNVDPGFQPSNVLTMQISLPTTRYDSPRKIWTFWNELVQRVETVPGVRAAGMARTLPLTARYVAAVLVEGQPNVEPTRLPGMSMQVVTPGLFRTLEIPLRRGREFTGADGPDAPPVVIINESFARKFWPSYPQGPSPVGRHMQLGNPRNPHEEIVGIVGDVHESGQAQDAPPEFYVPCAQAAPQKAYLTVRTTNRPLAFAEAVRNQVRAIDPDQAVSDVRTMDDVLDLATGRQRSSLLLLGLFAGAALLLAAIGIYGSIAYSVAQRTQEFGIRRALGARSTSIVALMLRQGMSLVLAGVVLGILGALALTRVMTSLLYHVSPTDPLIFGGVAMVFILVGLAAIHVPAWRATRIDPMTALR